MEPLEIAMMVSNRVNMRGPLSARPDAPIVPYVEKVPRSYAIRAALATGLRQVADLASPPLLAAHARTARLKLSAANGSGVATWDGSHCKPSRSMSA